MQRAKMFTMGLVLLALLIGILPVCAEAGDFTYGGDLRVRQSSFTNAQLRVLHPATGESMFLNWNMFRIRPRVWGQYAISDNMAVRCQITNEFRHWLSPQDKIDDDVQKFPDEWGIDNLYLDMKGIAGGNLDLRIGRQNIIYGTGKLILDGTPGDGSRTIYMDAIKATWKGFDSMTIDILGIYNSAENLLVVNGQDLPLTNYTKKDVNLEMNEVGVGLYVKHKGLTENMPFEAYYLLKTEAEYTLADDSKIPSASINTIGLRVMPKLSDSLSGNLEIAYQIGSQGDGDRSGYMVDAKLTMQLPAKDQFKSAASAGLYLLSGDDPDTEADDEGWTPAFSRWPQYSELYIYAMAADRASVADWSNVMMPYVELKLVPDPRLSITALLGLMSAPQKNGSGGGSGRGTLFTLWNKTTIKKGLFREQDALNSHVLFEMVKPGDYYAADDPINTMTWIRWEFMYSFK
jgi:hypothetical protein